MSRWDRWKWEAFLFAVYAIGYGVFDALDPGDVTWPGTITLVLMLIAANELGQAEGKSATREGHDDV